ncbi:MAG: Hsp20/alpha crystallin family protein [Desulfuromonadales bacterium]|nr:Hsp20/alpha crystallin family protein [Desulfuromonadales bacterium]
MSRFSGKKPFHQEIFSRQIGEIRSLLLALELRDCNNGCENCPPVDIYETCDKIILEFDLPGFRLEDICLTVCGQTLVLEAQRPREQAECFACLERSHGRFHHTVHIPCSFDACAISAEYRRGVLRVMCPKINDRKVFIKEIVD